MAIQELITLLLISIGTVVMVLAIRQTRRLLLLVTRSRYRRHWRILQMLMVMFAVGYLLVSIMILVGQIGWLTLLAGVIFLFGAFFVLLIVYSSVLTIQDLHDTLVSADTLRRLNSELAAAKEQAEAASQSKSRFLSSMSHELRTPLNAILGFGQLMEMEEGIRDEQKARVEMILTASNHLLALVNEVLDLSKLESGEIELKLQNCSPAQLIGEVIALLKPLAQRRNITIAVAADSAVAVVADETRLRQVVINLVSNAIKYNSLAGHVSIETFIEDDFLRLTVSDQGPGIPPEMKETIFEPFERLDIHRHDIEGTGIGLALSKQFVRLMNGDIGVESGPEAGSTFWIRLPVAGMTAASSA